MRYLLDTDVFSALARGLSSPLTARVQAIGLPALAISVITEGEVRYGEAYQPREASLTARIDVLLRQLHRLPITSEVVAPYAALRAHLRREGTPIGSNDFWIAAQALALNLVLVSGNTREFNRVPGLVVENWLR